MGMPKPFRLWYYLRTGYSLYFTFIFATVNVMTVTYYLAIDNLPVLKEIFPAFTDYVLTLVVLGVPVLVLTGWLHFRRSSAFKSEAEIGIESNPYYYKIPPGFMTHAVMPYYLMSTKMLVKISKKEPITEEELKEINELEKQMDLLIKGGYVGDYRQKD